jgi:NADPH2:quinone reductase
MKTLANWVAEGKLKPHVHKTFPLERTADAIRELDNRAVSGKVIIQVA